MLVQHYILTRSPYFAEVCAWLESRSISVDIHLNRTRFTLDSDTSLYTEFLLRWAGIAPIVDPRSDPATGLVEDILESTARSMALAIDQMVLDSVRKSVSEPLELLILDKYQYDNIQSTTSTDRRRLGRSA